MNTVIVLIYLLFFIYIVYNTLYEHFYLTILGVPTFIFGVPTFIFGDPTFYFQVLLQVFYTPLFYYPI